MERPCTPGSTTKVYLVALLTAGTGVFAQNAPQYEVVDLTELVGAIEGEAYDVNDLGEVVLKLEIDGKRVDVDDRAPRCVDEQ